MKYYSAKTVTKILGVTAQTLRNWDKEGKLKPTYVKSNGYRYYSEESILSYTQERKTKKNLSVIGYARVSSKKQSDDLERQAENIKKFLSTKYESFDIITDIGSGINYTKPGLLKLIEKNFENKRIGTTLLGSSNYDGNGNREEILNIFNDVVSKNEYFIYDYEQRNYREVNNEKWRKITELVGKIPYEELRKLKDEYIHTRKYGIYNKNKIE